MTEQQHLITPPLELCRLWAEQARRMYSHDPVAWIEHVANQAARWGWKQRDASVPEELQKARGDELEACCEWLAKYRKPILAADLRLARRPKPPSLAEEALTSLSHLKIDLRQFGLGAGNNDIHTIRAALERLQELEKGNE